MKEGCVFIKEIRPSFYLFNINLFFIMNKKITIKALALAGMLAVAPGYAKAQSYAPSASTTVYDFAKFGDFELLQLFEKVAKEGRKYPTVQELKTAGIYDELEFVRSHVRKRNILPRTDRLVTDTYEKRELFMNLPSGAGRTTGGYPSKDFASDNYSMWNYTNLFGSWNHGLFQSPGAWGDAAHKNGTDIMSGVKFFDTTGGRGQGAGSWMSIIKSRNSDNSFTYAQALINLLRFMGMDGINYNWEASGYNDPTVIEFHQKLYEIAKAEGFDNFHIAIYTLQSSLPQGDTKALFGANGKKTTDLMLNYSSSDFSYSMASSVRAAEAAMGTAEGLYAGVWIVSMDRGWSRLNNGDAIRCGLCLWGEHEQSRFWSYNTGGDPQERMSNYQMILERAFSGGHRNPAQRPYVTNSGHNMEWSGTTPPLSNFAGLATWIPERSAIQGHLPFSTHFNTGVGALYNYKGKKTAGSWYNMSNQDIVPTYRWLVYDGNTTNVSTAIQPEFTSTDAYTGGACLQLTGKASATSTDIILYKTQLQGTAGDIYANIAIKTGKATAAASNLSLIVRLSNGTWKEYAVDGTQNSNWVEHKIKLSDLTSTDVIDRIGLRVKNSNNTYKLLVGKLELTDNFSATPGTVKDLTVQVKEETQTSLSVKASWVVNSTTAPTTGLLYNDEANIDHFEILYKNGENGRVSEIARTSQWAAYVGDIDLTNVTEKPFIGVRAVATDLKTYSPVVWTEIPRAAQSQLPVRVENLYGTPELDMSASGYQTAQQIRYIKRLETTGGIENINYTATGAAGGINYVDATSHVLKVAQGATVTLKLQGYEATDSHDGSHDDLRYCMGRGWMDLDGDHQFNSEEITTHPNVGENLFFVGQVRKGTEALVKQMNNFTFTVPSDARLGKTRLRLVFSDAWFPGALLPTGKFNKGFAIDFGVEITGSNAERPIPGDTRDKGQADQPEGLTTTGINTVTAGEASNVELTVDGLNFTHVEKAWIFTTDGVLVKALNNPTTYNVNALPKGIYLVKMQNKNVIRTYKVTIN